MNLRDVIKSRRDVKRYSHKKPDWRKIIRAIDAARYSPNASGQFAMRFILVSDSDLINEISKQTQQPFVGEAHYLVVAVSDDSKLVRLYNERGGRYSSLQAGAAIENFLIALTEFKLVTYWVKYFYDDGVKSILGIPEKMSVEGIFPIGIETKIKTPEEKKVDLENYIFFDKWGEKNMEPQTRVMADNV